MTKHRMDDFSKFAMSFLSLAKNRKLVNRFDIEEINDRIKAIPDYKAVILDPTLLDDLTVEYARWGKSKNLFVMLAILSELHAKALSKEAVAATGQEAAEEEEVEEKFEEEETDDDGDDDTKQLIDGLKKYETLLEKYINMQAFKEFALRIRFVGNAGGWMQDKLESAKFKIYRFRNTIMDYKNRIDNAAFEAFDLAVKNSPDGPRKTLLLITAWLSVKIISIILLAVLIISRPTLLLEKIGIEPDMLPLPVE